MGNASLKQGHHVVDTTQTDSEPLAVTKAQAAAVHERPESLVPAAETESAEERLTEHPLGTAVTASEAQIPIASTEPPQEQTEAKPVPQTREKRELSSSDKLSGRDTTHGDKDSATSGKSEEKERKKQKIESKKLARNPSQVTTDSGPVPSDDDASSGTSKKSGRPKSDKLKETLKRAISTEGVSSRTRSRTKPT